MLLVFSLAALAFSFVVSKKLKIARKEKEELTEVLEDAVATIGSTKGKEKPMLKPKELEVLDLIAKGYTNAEIACAMSLSPDTIKWYKKKFFVMFDVANSAELVKVANEIGIL